MAGLALPPPPADRVEQLQQFYKIHDVTLMDEAELILSEHSFEDVAEQLRNKYEKFDFSDMATAASAAVEESSDGYMGNMVVNEICDTERAFLDKMTFLREKYVDALYEVLAGKGGKDAAASLGLDLEQANQVFTPLGNVVRFSRALLDKLEVISLVRTRPRSGRARAYFVAEAFLAMAPKLHAYAPTITTYKSNLEVVTEATKHAKSGGKYLNFVEWWDKVANSSELLRGQALQAILIMPMQRIPRYEMLLKELLKRCDDEASKPLIEQALEAFSTAAKEINEAVRTHEKVSKFFGAGAELKPLRATTTVGKDGATKIHNEYAVALPKKFT